MRDIFTIGNILLSELDLVELYTQFSKYYRYFFNFRRMKLINYFETIEVKEKNFNLLMQNWNLKTYTNSIFLGVIFTKECD